MAAVTWRYVPRGTCHVPQHEPFEKCCVRAAAQTGSGREPKLSGQKRLGLNCDIRRIIPEGSKLCPQEAISFFSLMPSSSDTLGPRDPKFGARVHVNKGYPRMHHLGGFQKLEVKIIDFWKFLDFFSFFIIRPKMLKMTFFDNSKF